jgi:hypothetical protein
VSPALPFVWTMWTIKPRRGVVRLWMDVAPACDPSRDALAPKPEAGTVGLTCTLAQSSRQAEDCGRGEVLGRDPCLAPTIGDPRSRRLAHLLQPHSEGRKLDAGRSKRHGTRR